MLHPTHRASVPHSIPPIEPLTWSELFKVLPGLAKAAMMAVVVVPMLAPSVSGYALSILITPTPGREYKVHNISPRG